MHFITMDQSMTSYLKLYIWGHGKNRERVLSYLTLLSLYPLNDFTTIVPRRVLLGEVFFVR